MRREIIICGFWLLLSFYLSVASYRLGLSTGNRPGPGFFPLIATAGIGLIAGFRLIHSLQKRPPDNDFEPGSAGEARLVLYVIAAMIVYALLLDLIGFLLCTFLLVAFYIKVIAARRWLVTLSFAAAAALTSHLVFDTLLKAGLPRGLLSWLI